MYCVPIYGNLNILIYGKHKYITLNTLNILYV